MGMLFCYTLFGRKSKTSASKTSLRAIRKICLERVDLSKRDTSEVKGMDKHVETVLTLPVGDEILQDDGAECVIDCSALVVSLPPGQLGPEKGSDSSGKPDANETVVDINKIPSLEDAHRKEELHHPDLANYECRLWSSCSLGTFQGDVSLSVGEGTVSSNEQRALLPRQHSVPSGDSRGACDDGSLEDSVEAFSNRSSNRKGFHDDHSAECEENFPRSTQFYDDTDADAAQALDQPFGRSEDVVEAGGHVESSYLVSRGDAHVDKDDVHSGHASDPGFYEREVLKISPSVTEDEAGCQKSSLLPLESSGVRRSNQGFTHNDMDPSFDRIKEWISNIQQADMEFGFEDESLDASGKLVELSDIEACEAPVALRSMEHSSADHVVAHTAVRSLHPSSTVAHLSGSGLRDMPALGMFSSLRTLNLSANLIAHIPGGCLPRSIHSLDLSKNRIAQIEGFRELTRLRVLNLSHNRISRIGHGLANCTLIKELYLAGNKIGEVEGLHRLLKLAVLDLSFNKVTTSKALGQLAANYGSLLALNLLGNPILTNFSEDQVRKLVTALAPHVTYLNRQPIKMVSVREAALDSVARAALGSSHRLSKSRDAKAVRRLPDAPLSSVKKKPPPHQLIRHSDRKPASSASGGHHRHHHHQHGKTLVKGQGRESTASLKALREGKNIVLHSGRRPMHRSRSAEVLQE